MNRTVGRIGLVSDLLRRGISPNYTDDGILVVNQKCIRPEGVLDLQYSRRHNEADREISEDLLIQPGDILINSTGTGTLGRSCVVREVEIPMTWDSHVTLVRPRQQKVHHSYLGWTIESEEQRLIELSIGSTNQIELSRGTVFNLEISLPPLETQERIADYLDEETSRIDNTVSTLDELIEEMKSRRVQLIQESISSSDSYVGLWEFAEINPSSPGFKTLPDGEKVPFLPLENVWSGRNAIYSETKEYKKSDTSYTKFQQGDILVPKVTPTVQHGRSMIAEIPDELGLASSEVHVVRAKDNADPRWITYNLLSRKFLDEARGNVYGVGGLQRISDLYLTHYKVAFESIENQTKIADFLDIETAKIDKIISTATELRSELLSRRSALITEVVTGKKKI